MYHFTLLQAHFRPGFRSQNEFHHISIISHLFLAKYWEHRELISPLWDSSANNVRHSQGKVILKEEMLNIPNHFWQGIRRPDIHLVAFPPISIFQDSTLNILAYLNDALSSFTDKFYHVTILTVSNLRVI